MQRRVYAMNLQSPLICRRITSDSTLKLHRGEIALKNESSPTDELNPTNSRKVERQYKLAAKFSIALTTLILFGISTARAEIFRCIDGDGRVQYSNGKIDRLTCTPVSRSVPVEQTGSNTDNRRNIKSKPLNAPPTYSSTPPELSKQQPIIISGSGFAVGNGSYVATNAHVVDRCASIAIIHGAISVAATIIASSDYDDLAVLKIQNHIGTTRPIRTDEPRIGESVMAAGFPLAGILSSGINVSTGIINSTDGIRGDKNRIQISAPIQPGNSGGPILDAKGNIVGVVVGKLNALRVANQTGDVPQNINFAIKPTRLISFLAKNGVEFSRKQGTEKVDNETLAQIANELTVQVICHRPNLAP